MIEKIKKYLGEKVKVRFEKIIVHCYVQDVRQAFGRTDLLVSPVEGAESQWVEENRVFKI